MAGTQTQSSASFSAAPVRDNREAQLYVATPNFDQYIINPDVQGPAQITSGDWLKLRLNASLTFLKPQTFTVTAQH